MATPPANATRTTFQVGTWNRNSDTFTPTLDINDGVTYFIGYQGHTLQQPEKRYSEGYNLRMQGNNVARWSYGLMHYGLSLRVQASSSAAVIAAVHALIQAIENPPYTIRIAAVGAGIYHYLDVLKVSHTIPYDPNLVLAKAQTGITIDFQCYPGFRRDRVIVRNEVCNPSANAGSGQPITVFTDTTFTNFNPYTVAAGGPLTNDTTRYTDAVQAEASLRRYYRLDESAGGTANDAAGVANATYNGTVTYSATGALNGSTDTAVTLDGSTAYVSCSSATGLPTGNAAHALDCWVKISANPSGGVFVLCLGNGNVAGAFSALQITSAGKAQWSNSTTTVTAASALSLNTWHHIGCTYDGTTLTLEVDGSSVGTATPTMALAYATSPVLIGARFTTVYGSFLPGSVDEAAVYGAGIGLTRLTAHYNTGHNAPATNAASLAMPGSSRISFGSSAWSNHNQTSVCYRYNGAQTGTFYLHRTDANNYLAVVIGGGTMSLVNVLAGVTNTLGSVGVTLVAEMQYWLVVSQFPAAVGANANLSATLYPNSAGVPSSTVIGTLSQDYSTDTLAFPSTLVGAMQIGNNSTALDISAITVQQFGPGAWSFNGAGGTGLAAGAWEQNQANCYAGLVQSVGAARIDCAPVGTVTAQWVAGYSGSAAAMAKYGISVTQGQVLGASVYLDGPSLGGSAVVTLGMLEYDANGNQLANGVVATHTGAYASYAQLSGTYTVTNAGTKYCLLYVKLVDSTTGSQGATLWIENAQGWNQTTTGQTTMPYAETRFEQLPAQINVTGIVGDMPAPAILVVGTNFGTSLAASTTATLYLGRRAVANSASQLVQPLSVFLNNAFLSGLTVSQPTATQDTTAWGGYTLSQLGVSLKIPVPVFGNLVSLATMQGRFNLLTRAQTAGGTASAVTLQSVSSVLGTPNASYNNTSVSPFAANSTWYGIDTGDATPLWGMASSAANLSSSDLSQQMELSTNYVIGKSVTANYLALLPTDAEKQVIKLSSGTQATAAGWVHTYIDGYNGSVSFTTDVAAASNISDALITGNNSGYISVTNAGDPVPLADPTTAGGLNQYVLAGVDGSGNILPGAVEVWYWPRDLWP